MAIRGLTNIRASASLTTSYVAASVVNCREADSIILLIGYTMGAAETANAVIFKVEWSMDGTTYFQDANFSANSDAITDGAVTIDKNEFTYTADSVAATYDYIAVPLKALGQMVKVSFKETGVVANAGTCVAYISFVE